MKFSYEEVLSKSTEYFNGDDLAGRVFTDKYALRDGDGELLEDNPEMMHRRLAKEFARIEKNKFKRPLGEEEIFQLLDKFRYIIPQGSILYSLGNNDQYSTLSNCYVIESPEDSYGAILRADQHLVQVSKRRGGVGIDLSKLRPRGSKTKNAARSSTGIISWMERYSNSIREVGQDGRRGALMITLSVHHPDVLDFVTIKNDPLKVTGANISLRLSNEFLQAVENNEEYELRFPVDSTNIVKKIPAKQVWDKIIHSAWLRAEPGLMFWDNVIKNNAIDCYADVGFETVSSNPCGELPLCEDDSCRLLIQNLYSYVKNPFEDNATFDYDLYEKHVKIAQRLMDDVIDLELEKIDKITKKIKEDPEDELIKREELQLWHQIWQKCYNGRRTGLGITGLGDMLAALGVKYACEQSLMIADHLFYTLKLAALTSSCEMAEELGPFPVWDWEKEKDSPFFDDIKKVNWELYERLAKYGRRNIGHLTIAPTGSMSILTQTTSGIEPLFELKPYKRRKKINPSDKEARVDFRDSSGDCWQEFLVYHPKVRIWMEKSGNTDITNSPWFGCTANDLDWVQRVKLQAVAQRSIDHAISSTINLPENVTEEKVGEIYLAAWKAGCKGITVYRDNCRTGVLVREKETVNKRPRKLPCDIHHITVKGQKYYVAIGLKEDNSVYEIFCGLNGTIQAAITKGYIQRIKSGKYALISDNEVLIDDMCDLSSDEEESVARLASVALRNNVDIKIILEQLEKTRGQLYGFTRAIVKILRKYILTGTLSTEMCPQCNSQLIFTEGCKSCKCGWSKC